MKPEEYMLTEEEAEAVISAVRISKGLIEQNALNLENSDFLHKCLASALYKLTEGKEGVIVPT